MERVYKDAVLIILWALNAKSVSMANLVNIVI